MSPAKLKSTKDTKSSSKSKDSSKSPNKASTPGSKPPTSKEKNDPSIAKTLSKETSKTPKTNKQNKDKKPLPEGKPSGSQISYKRIKLFTFLFMLVAIVLIILAFDQLLTAITIRSKFGAYLNMISTGEGEVLPTLLALPVFIALVLDIAIMVFTYKLFGEKTDPRSNKILFYLIAAALGAMVLTVVMIFATLGHIFGSSKHVENGIMKAMEKYADSSYYKKQIDRLQIEFQCCGSEKYEDWFNVSWTDKALSPNGSVPSKTPFSCCKIKTKFPCIHFGIDCIGLSYHYVPEFNLSVSSTGCHAKIVNKKRKIGISIVINLFLFIFLEVLMLVPTRFLQTAHSIDYKFSGRSKTYSVWLFGSRPNSASDSASPLEKDEKNAKTPKNKAPNKSNEPPKSGKIEPSSRGATKNKEVGKKPPAVPPVPAELKT